MKEKGIRWSQTLKSGGYTKKWKKGQERQYQQEKREYTEWIPEKTARKYVKEGKLPSEMKVGHPT